MTLQHKMSITGILEIHSDAALDPCCFPELLYQQNGEVLFKNHIILISSPIAGIASTQPALVDDV